MSCYNYTHFLKEFADRTLRNLEVIDRACDGSATYEVTQLINSLLGLLVVPSERYKYSPKTKHGAYCGCSEKQLRAIGQESYAKLKDIINHLRSAGKLYNDYPNGMRYPVGDFITHLRNSVCHSGNDTLLFFPIEENQAIKTVIFFDTDQEYIKENAHKFCTELTIGEIREIILLISKIYVGIETKKSEEAQKRYIAIGKKCRQLMNRNIDKT